MKVRALRGVCIGVDHHLKAGDPADLEAAQVQFLVSIGAVERVAPEPIQPDQEELAPQKPPAAPAKPQPAASDKKSGKKEK